MKTRYVISTIAFSLLFIVLGIPYGCSTSGPSTATKQRPAYGYGSLLDMLRKQPQLDISGSDYNVTIRIRGSRSIAYNNEPLFVVDGAPIGTGYNSASSIDVNNVESIRVLAGSQASIYGMRGANGVVVIKTK